MKYALTFTLVILFTFLNTGFMLKPQEHIYQKHYVKQHKLSAVVVHEVVIHKSRQEVWDVVSNWGDAYIFTPGLDSSYCPRTEKTGLSSKRHCDVGKGSVEEEVLLWEPGKRFIQQVYEMQNVPMIKKIVVELEIEDIDQESCKLIYAMAYKMTMGKLMKGTMSKNIKTNAYSVKHYVETGDATVAKDAKKIQQLYF